MEEMRDRLQSTNQSVTNFLDRNTLDHLQEALQIPVVETNSGSEYQRGDADTVESPGFDDHFLEASVSDASDEDN